MRSRWLLLWLFSGALVALTCAVHDSEARIKRRWICEEWRDYWYDAHTGAFLEWAGEAYWICHQEGEPVSLPPGADRDRYSGGMGQPRDPRVARCMQCTTQHAACLEGIARGTGRCVKHHRELYQQWCVMHRRERLGQPIQGEYRCTVRINGLGVPRRVCEGEAIDRCVESFARDTPDTTQQNSLSMKLGTNSFGLSGSGSVTVKWGGTLGYMSACNMAGQQVGLTCLEELDTCAERAGGCE